MKDMKSFDELMPSVGIFWYDPQEHDFFGVYKDGEKKISKDNREYHICRIAVVFVHLQTRQSSEKLFYQLYDIVKNTEMNISANMKYQLQSAFTNPV